MDNLRQTALDYTLGVLPKEDSLLFEALLEHDDEAKSSLVMAQDECAKLSLIAEPATLGNEVRARVMEYTKPRINLDPILESLEIETLSPEQTTSWKDFLQLGKGRWHDPSGGAAARPNPPARDLFF